MEGNKHDDPDWNPRGAIAGKDFLFLIPFFRRVRTVDHR